MSRHQLAASKCRQRLQPRRAHRRPAPKRVLSSRASPLSAMTSLDRAQPLPWADRAVFGQTWQLGVSDPDAAGTAQRAGSCQTEATALLRHARGKESYR